MKQIFLFLFVLIFTQTKAQVDINYQKPPKEILDLVDIPLPPSFRYLNSEGTQAVLLYRHPYKSIAELSEPEMRLAGLRINPNTYISSRERYYFQISLYDLNKKEEIPVTGLSEDSRLSNFSMSPDEKKIGFTRTTDKGVELWTLDRKTHMAFRLTSFNLNVNLGNSFVWLKDSNCLLVKMKSRSEDELMDKSEVVPTGPTVSVNHGQKAQNRTYQDLLKDKTDEHNFDVLSHSTIYQICLDGTNEEWMGEAIYRDIDISPNGEFVLIETIRKPYSYLVPYYRFPTSTGVYDLSGQLVNQINETGLIEELPQGRMSVQTGMRSIGWRSDKPATLYWTEALDGGDPANETEYRDAVYERDIPFNQPKRQLLQTKNRYRGITWGSENRAIAYDLWWNDRNTKTYLFNPGDPGQEPIIISDMNYQDRYNDPGEFVTEKNQYGLHVLLEKDGDLFLTGDGYSDEGNHPFLDRFHISDLTTERLWQDEEDEQLEEIVEIIDIADGKVLTMIQSAHVYPNFYSRNVYSEREPEPITSFENPFHSLTGVHKELITYQREDGVDLSATLFLPPGYKKDSKEKLPMLMWAYPREFKDAQSASQITSSPYEFTYPTYGSPIFWVMRGFAVLDDTAFPIIGEGEEEPNDSFIKQLVANAKAAIDAVDEFGYIDTNRVAVGGHSYGAFMTANLLSHSDLFAAGIARSGAYNRTLTPFGFQSEERTYWDAPNIYYEMSPFMHADKMKTPLLLLHGVADNNSGTYPLQSQRYFNALKGLGATVRLVMLPKESHGYAAKESIYHMLWEQDQWLEKYVKNKGGDTASRP